MRRIGWVGSFVALACGTTSSDSADPTTTGAAETGIATNTEASTDDPTVSDSASESPTASPTSVGDDDDAGDDHDCGPPQVCDDSDCTLETCVAHDFGECAESERIASCEYTDEGDGFCAGSICSCICPPDRGTSSSGGTDASTSTGAESSSSGESSAGPQTG